LAQAKTKLVAFLRDKKGYPWRPFDVVKRPAAPKVKNAAWARNAIDAFIAAEHEAFGLAPRPEAPREVILRRVYLDLIGLPPTPAQLHAFLNDTSATAYEKVVDDLLSRPQYGERWGRHWMDIWRYSDWAGYGPQVRDSQPHIWHWRDWIIDSLNADKGYDRMILEMLAGDELAPEDPKVLVGTGYLVRNYKLLSREKWMQDTIEHTFMAFQGVTIGCAKCHDHLFDPILQTEYYQVRAIFEPHNVRTDRIPGELNTKKEGLVRVYDRDLAADTQFFIRGDDRTPDKNKVIKPGVPDVLGGRFPEIEPISLPRDAITPEKSVAHIRELIDLATIEVTKVSQELRNLHLELKLLEIPDPPENAKAQLLEKSEKHKTLELLLQVKQTARDALIKTLVAEKLEDDGKLNSDAWKKAATEAMHAQRHEAFAQAKLALREADVKLAAAKANTPSAMAAKKALDDAMKTYKKLEKDAQAPPTINYKKRSITSYPAQSTGRRLAFAKWLANRDNPLTARVAVNHIWMRHFGQAIVPSVFDFGRNGRPPSHPALLDWLAAEFMNSPPLSSAPLPEGEGRKWSMKHLHRLIVTSSAYRQASTPDLANAQIDRDNKFLWRYPPHRLEAEAVRDCVFYVAGKLDLKMGGPDIDYPLGLTVPRRSLYFRHAAEKQMEFLMLFDAASVTECYERRHSIVPQQALALMNSELSLKQARILARAIAGTSSGPETFTVSAFEHLLTRAPTKAERTECVTFLQEQTRRFQTMTLTGGNTTDGSQPSADPAQRARENLVHALMNHHEFVTVR
jgi:hypothetical protein